MASLKSSGLFTEKWQNVEADVSFQASHFFNPKYAFLKSINEGKSSLLTTCIQAKGFKNLRIHCSLLEKVQKVSKRTVLHELYDEQKQSPWYDNLWRPVADLKPFIDSGIRGITSNPTIFQKTISSSSAYDDQFRQLIAEGKGVEDAYWGLVIKDIQDACKLLQGIFEESNHEDGYVSVELSPRIAHEMDETVEAAKWLHSVINQPNANIKIPATAECVPSIKKVISLGINVNITLIFSLPRYEAVIEAYMEGLESLEQLDLSVVSSFAAFYVSRVDTLVDKQLEEIGTEEALALRGKAAIAQATLAYKLYQEKFSGTRWEALKSRGARKQRLMWASTNVKNPAYPSTHYVSPLIGPETISTMPDAALEAFMSHGIVSRTVDRNYVEAQRVYEKIEELGICWADIGSLLELEGLDSFKKSFDDLLISLEKKATVLLKP